MKNGKCKMRGEKWKDRGVRVLENPVKRARGLRNFAFLISHFPFCNGFLFIGFWR
jgi:hypothetical protein